MFDWGVLKSQNPGIEPTHPSFYTSFHIFTDIYHFLSFFPTNLLILTTMQVATILSPACGRKPWSGDYKTPSVRASVHSSRFYINLNISFNYKDIFTKFAGNVYGYENLSLQNFSMILKNKMAAIANCLKIIKVL